MPRSRAVIAAAIALAVLLVGFVAFKSSGGDDSVELKNTNAQNCNPVARTDVIATRPGEAIAIDVLANDTDPDGDQLVFQVVKTDGGVSTVDDGDTPTDASDDRVLFTPADPPVDATIEYQAVDTAGGTGESTVSVTVNDSGTLPDGVRSAAVTELGSGTADGRCAESNVEGNTTTSQTSTTLVPTPAPGPVTTIKATGGGGDKKTDGKKPTSKKTTTTTKKPGSSTPTTQGSPGTTQPPNTTTTKPTTTTSRPPTTQPSNCGSPDPNSPSYNPDFKECIQGRGTTTTVP